jgi:hypothetical protein
MKKYISSGLILTLFFFLQTTLLNAQEQTAETEDVEKSEVKKEKDEVTKIQKTDKHTEIVKYRRGSLHTMIIEDDNLPKKDLILNTFKNAEFPDKYNNHTIGDKSFNIKDYQDKINEVKEGKKAKDKDFSAAIDQYFKDTKLANKMIAKWFNRSEEGTFDMSLIQERGAYDASAQAADMALSTERGLDMLKDAGIELINNTFVVVNYSKFVSNEETAKIAYDIAKDAAGKLPGALQETALEIAKNAYEKARQGYSIWTTAYLYQMQWNDSIEATFYMDMWMDSTSIDSTKKTVFDSSDLFQLKLLGYEKTRALISGLGSNAESEEMIIENATLKSINSVYNKLQRKFEPFRTKTPLVSIEPLGAKIGLKEGLEGGDKYEVLEQVFDAEGRITYKRKGIIKVDKKNIWNNKYNIGEEPLDEEGNPIEIENDIEFTYFKGGKGYYPGMLIRQIN